MEQQANRVKEAREMYWISIDLVREKHMTPIFTTV